MKRAILFALGLLLMQATFSVPVQAQTGQGNKSISIRAWQFHVPKVDYIRGAMGKAKEYDVNTVVFSHEIIGYVSELYRGKDFEKRAAMLRELSKDARGLGLKSYIWVRELERDVPDNYLENGVVQLDKDGFWKWLDGKYDKLFTDFPEFDGVILTFHETNYKIFDDKKVKSALPKAERFAKMMNTINDACARHKKDFIARSFLYEPEQIAWFSEGMKSVDPRVMLQAKCEPHDWQPFYPHEPMIGKYPDRPLIVEFDCSSEFTGRNRVPWTSPDFFEYRWRYDEKQPGVVGYNARLDHAGYDALYTPNEINIYSLYRLTQDPKITANDIWKEWTEKHYGKEAAPFVEKALRPSFDALNKSFFILEFWITDHSRLPSYSYANGHISSRTIAKWRPEEPKYAELEKALNHPDPILLERILKEKDEAIALVDQELNALKLARPHLKPEQYDDLYWRINMLRRVAEIWKLHSEAFFGLKVLEEGHKVEGLAERVERAADGLIAQAEVSKLEQSAAKSADAGEQPENLPPVGPNQIRKVADELKSRLADVKAGKKPKANSKSEPGTAE